jgi:hypothetical protein
MATLPRTAANTKYGHHVSVLSVDGVNYIGTFTNAGVSYTTELVEGRAVSDTWDHHAAKISQCTMDLTKVVESTAPLIALAAGICNFTGIWSHYNGGPQRTASFQITNAKLDIVDGVCTESLTAVSQGAITIDTSSNAPAARLTQTQTRYGQDTATVAIGTDDYVNLFTNASFSIDVQTADTAAIMDTWKHTRAISRKCTLTVGKVVELTLPFIQLLEAQAALNVSITINQGDGSGVITISGSFMPSGAKLDMPDGAQSEEITLTLIGALTVTAP